MACKMDGRSTVELLFELRRVSNELALLYNSSSAKGSNGVFFLLMLMKYLLSKFISMIK